MTRRPARDAELRWRWHTRGERAMIAASERDVRAAAGSSSLFSLKCTRGSWGTCSTPRILSAYKFDGF